MENLPSENISGQLSVATYNLCGLHEKDELLDILDILVKASPDVLAMQGLTKLNCDVVFRKLKSSGYSYSRFDLAISVDNSILPRSQLKRTRASFEILFAKNDIAIIKKEYVPFVRTNHNRGISKYLISVGKYVLKEPINVWIYTSQLETGAEGNADRKFQIAEIESERIKNSNTGGSVVIFAGDTSIPSWQENSVKCPQGWIDAWREKGNSQNEKTTFYDRMDQIWCFSDENLTLENFFKIEMGNSLIETRAAIYVIFSYESPAP